MRTAPHKGRLSSWKEDRGFGFIRPDDGTKEVFLHISALAGASRRPRAGDTILYELTIGRDGRLRAAHASIEGVAHAPRSSGPRAKGPGLLQTAAGAAAIAVIALLSGKLTDQRSRPPIPATTSILSMRKPGCDIKGNISIDSGEKLYHVPGSRDYERTTIRPEDGERWFCSEAEAVAHGWRKSPW